MDIICEADKCTGCSLCAARCPKSSISMQEGSFGHLYPKINQTTCIDCGLCKKVCPANNQPLLNQPLTAYAAWAKDEKEYVSSTSGGAASLMSRFIIEHGGVVYGCSVEKGLVVKHIRVDNVSDIDLLKGSKYVQSDIKEVLPPLKRDVATGKRVLFIGTPCQCAAVKGLFSKTKYPDNLYLVDLICHGVPSLNVLQHHVEKNLHVNLDKVHDVKFRSDNDFKIVLYDKDKRKILETASIKERYKDFYYNAFWDGFTYRESCYTCHYAKSERVSDITIGDFWGLKGLNDKSLPSHLYGISVVLPVTDKGLKLFEETSSGFFFEERELKEAVSGNDQLRHPKEKNVYVKLFRLLSDNCHLKMETSYAIVVSIIKMRKVVRRLKRRIYKS